MKKLITILSLSAIFCLFFACQKDNACLSPENDCNCPLGYEGTNCEVKTTQKFIGTYKSVDTVFSTSYVIIKEVNNAVNKVEINYFAKLNGTEGSKVIGDVDGTLVRIPLQKAVSTSGSEKLEGELILEINGTTPRVITRMKYDFLQSYIRNVWKKS